MSDENQGNGEDGGQEAPQEKPDTFWGRHGCLLTIVGILIVGAGLGLWGFVSWLERGN